MAENETWPFSKGFWHLGLSGKYQYAVELEEHRPLFTGGGSEICSYILEGRSCNQLWAEDVYELTQIVEKMANHISHLFMMLYNANMQFAFDTDYAFGNKLETAFRSTSVESMVNNQLFKPHTFIPRGPAPWWDSYFDASNSYG